jgi:two-component system, cell cycle sensor histidine kinase PleC
VTDRFTEMLGVLAHEMRTPISAILGYQELLSEGIFGEIDERGHEPLARIAYSAKQLLHLIDGVQEVASPPEKQLEVHPAPFDPAPVLQECIRNALTDATGRNVTVEPDIASDLPHVHGDPDRFCRAVDLALAAAIKTSYGATLGVAAQASDSFIQISISGTGLNPHKDDPGATDLRTNGSKQLTGAGLRLAIVRHLARQMDGDVALLPADGTTTLRLELPVSS